MTGATTAVEATVWPRSPAGEPGHITLAHGVFVDDVGAHEFIRHQVQTLPDRGVNDVMIQLVTVDGVGRARPTRNIVGSTESVPADLDHPDQAAHAISSVLTLIVQTRSVDGTDTQLAAFTEVRGGAAHRRTGAVRYRTAVAVGEADGAGDAFPSEHAGAMRPAAAVTGLRHAWSLSKASSRDTDLPLRVDRGGDGSAVGTARFSTHGCNGLKRRGSWFTGSRTDPPARILRHPVSWVRTHRRHVPAPLPGRRYRTSRHLHRLYMPLAAASRPHGRGVTTNKVVSGRSVATIVRVLPHRILTTSLVSPLFCRPGCCDLRHRIGPPESFPGRYVRNAFYFGDICSIEHSFCKLRRLTSVDNGNNYLIAPTVVVG